MPPATHLGGRLPLRVDAATKTALLDLVQGALDAGWDLARACRVLELPVRRVHRWRVRRRHGELADKRPGGGAVHGILESEEREILALFDEWGETDRSHRKLAHRGSYLHRVWVSPSTVRRGASPGGQARPPTAQARHVEADTIPGVGRLPTEQHLDI
jgi:putative transposase